MTASAAPVSQDECFRCGYDIRGIANDQPCPECGLLTERSRRTTDELHNTRPRWLWKIAWGVRLILISLLLALSWPIVSLFLIKMGSASGGSIITTKSLGGFLFEQLPLFGLDVAWIALLIGVNLLTAREGYAPADRADRKFRSLVRWAVAMPLTVLMACHTASQIDYGNRFSLAPEFDTSPLRVLAEICSTIGCAPLPLLLLVQLRRLAKRARSAHLAEHCLIVGIGTSASLLYLGAEWLISANAERWGFGTYWIERSNIWLVIELLLSVAGFLFVGWNFYLLVRFAIAFGRASRQLRKSWQRDDRAASGVV